MRGQLVLLHLHPGLLHRVERLVDGLAFEVTRVLHLAEELALRTHLTALLVLLAEGDESRVAEYG